jgi:hypothetical protein
LRTESPPAFQEIGIGGVNNHRRPGTFLDFVQGGNMVGVAMGKDYRLDIEVHFFDCPDYFFGISAGIDNQTFLGVRITDNPAVCGKVTYHQPDDG